jgi:aminoglycoside N3'-acetyltransferase
MPITDQTFEMITMDDLRQGFERLGILGSKVVFHTSFKSFGKIDGGLDTYISFLCTNFQTLLAPAFTWESTIHPPEGDRPLQNGIDYSVRWKSPEKPFLVESASIDPRMGIVPRRLLELPRARRSIHPWHSWVSWGDGALDLVQPHPWDCTNLPLERLSSAGGYVALVGVSLKYCTAMHLAEECAGRRPFIRWAVDRDNTVKRIRVAGCANWFESMQPRLQHLIRSTQIGGAIVQAAPLGELIKTAAEIIREDPRAACCSEDCIKCRDALMGGPISPTEE